MLNSKEQTRADTIEAIFRPNNSLVNVILGVMREQGHSLGERLLMALRLRVLPRNKRQELEQAVTDLLVAHVNAGLVTLPVSVSVSTGVVVGSWQDLFEWFLENWSAILDINLAIISLF